MGTPIRVAIIGDVHGNYAALKAILHDAGAVDQIWFVGDVVNHGPQPNECIELLHERRALAVLGDHDRALLGDPGPQFTRISFLAAALAWTNDVIRPTSRKLLARYVEQLTIGAFTLVHDVADLARSPEGRPPARLPEADDFTRIATRHCLYGHVHLPLVCRVADERGQRSRSDGGSTILAPDTTTPIDLHHARVIANPGAVGFFEWEDGCASYLIADLDLTRSDGRLTPRCVRFDATSVLAKAQQVGMPEQTIGYWKRCVAQHALGGGDVGTAKTLLADSLHALDREGNLRQLGHLLVSCGQLALALDRPEHAAQLVAASIPLGAHPTVTYRADTQRPLLEAALAPGAFARAWQMGQQMTAARAVGLARAVVV